MNEDQKRLLELEVKAHSYPGEDLKPAMSAEIAGHLFTVSSHIVNRKCYDFLPTPTAQFKMDGKRVSRQAAYDALLAH